MKTKWTIDIVEDNEIVRSLLKYELEKNSMYRVRTYECGEFYMLGKEKEEADILVLDYFLDSQNKTSKDGLAILNELEKQGFAKPVIFFSGQQQLGVVIKALKNGAVDFVSKDSDTFIEDINLAVYQIVRKYRMHKAEILFKRNLIKGFFHFILAIGLLSLGLFI